MTKLISGRVKKIPSANVSASRYDFIKLSETEPDLGLPASNGYVLVSNVDGSRYWTMLTVGATDVANVVLTISNFTTSNLAEGVNLYYSNTRVYANVIPLLNTKANVVDLTTANVLETASGLYYTNARVYANISPLLNFKANVVDLTTANVSESASNLYYTIPRANAAIDERVTKAFVENLGLNVNAATFAQVSDAANTAVIAQTSNIANIVLSLSGLTTSNLLEGTNLYYSNARVYANVISLLDSKANVSDLTTANVLETASGLYYTNARVYANVISLLDNKANVVDLTTANVAESASNLYYTDARVYANVIGLLNAKANVVDLTTANVSESAGNLYYTNVRVLAGLANASVVVNDLEIKGNLQVLGNEVKISSITVEDKVIRLANGAATANIADGAGIAILGAGANITYRNTGDKLEINKPLDVLGTLTAPTIAGTVWNGLYTANVIETAGNLYYTDARARAALSAATGVAYDTSTGVISIGQNVSPNATVTFANLIVTGTTSFYGNVTTYSSNNLSISDNMIYLNNGSQTSNPDLGFAGNYNDGSYHHTGFFRDASDGVWKVFDNYSPEPDANIFIDTNHATFRLANIAATTVTANVVGNVTGYVSSINNFTTSNLAEGVNLYYSNARVYANVIGLINAKANVVDLTTANVLETASGLYYTNARVYSNVIGLLNAKANVVDLTTANVTETASGLYYTNARVYANVIGLLNAKANVVDLTTANIIESGNTTTGNVFFSNARARNAISAGDSTIIYDATTGTIRATANITASLFTTVNNLSTSNVSEGSNLYYSNDRVRSNVIALLPTLAGQNIVIAANGQISATTSANVVIAAGSITGLDTSNVAEAASNLYYTNARVYANIAPLLTTANVTEVGSNLYYTNNRVYANVVSLLPYYTGNISTGNVITTTLYANSIVGSAVGGYITGANLISSNNISALNWIGLYSANVIESSTNLFYTNSRVRSNVIALLPTLAGTGISIDANGVISASLGGVVTANTVVGLDTSNVAEAASNLYYTNARVYANVIGLLNTKANVVDLTTANVAEAASNLYYTNARVYANVVSLLPYYTGNISTGNVITTTLYANSIIGSAVGGYITGANLISANNISSLNWIGLYTANVTESAANLYYTNSRVRANVIDLLPTLAGSGILIDANGIISASLGGIVFANTVIGLTTANVSEFGNLYYTNARVYANVIGLLDLKANVVDLTTANVAESTSNLYYTNARVYANVVSLLPYYTGNISTGNVIATTVYANSIIGSAVGGYITGANLISANNISALNWIGLYTSNTIERGDTTTGNVFFTNARAIGAFTAGSGITIAANGLITSTATGTVSANSIVGLNTSNIEEGSNLYYTNTRVYANVISLLNAKANVVDLTTANIAESSSNLYYTNARVYANVIGLLTALSTSNIAEGSNLYYTNTRVYANIAPLLTTANVNEVGANLYYTNTRVAANVVALLQSNISIGNIIGNVTVTGNLIASGLIIRGINVTDTVLTGNVTAGSTSSDTITANNINAGNITTSILTANSIVGTALGGSITGANLISTNNISSLNWIGLYTANVIETSGNLYFTNTRVVSALVAGDNITIEANGRISSSGGGGVSSQLTVSSSQTLVGGNKNYTLASPVNNANSIIVSINGMVQAPAVDYTLNGGQGLQFSANTTANALIEVKYYGYSALSPNVAFVSSSVIIPTVAGQASYMMGANVTQAQSIIVALDGLIQQPTVDYTVNNTTITLLPAPPEGSNIEIRFFGQEAVALAGAQYTTAYISNSRTYAGGSANLDLGSNVALARNIIVTIDGITQIPDVNYTVSGNTLSFGTSVPDARSVVEVKFFGAEAFNANLTQAMVTSVLPTVLSNDTLVRQIIRSSAYAFSRIFY